MIVCLAEGFRPFLKIIFQSYLYVLIIGAGLQMQKSWPSINERLWRAKSTVPRVKPSVWQWSCHTLFKHPRLLNPKYPTCESSALLIESPRR